MCVSVLCPFLVWCNNRIGQAQLDALTKCEEGLAADLKELMEVLFKVDRVKPEDKVACDNFNTQVGIALSNLKMKESILKDAKTRFLAFAEGCGIKA